MVGLFLVANVGLCLQLIQFATNFTINFAKWSLLSILTSICESLLIFPKLRGNLNVWVSKFKNKKILLQISSFWLIIAVTKQKPILIIGNT